MRIIAMLFFILLSINAHSQCDTAKEQKTGWVFFDLGNTIIDTKQNLQKYMPGALEYINNLKKKGYCLGIISNIPVSWGENYAHRLLALKKYISKNWNSAEPAFQWDDFAIIFLPSSELEYKPKPKMFSDALRYARRKGAQNIYFQGEDLEEVETAHKTGFTSYQIKVLSDKKTKYLSL